MVGRVPVLHVHAPPQVGNLEHRAAPIRAVDVHQHRLRTKFRVTGDERLAIALHDHRIPAVAGLHFESAFLGQLPQIDTAFDLTANDIGVNLVAEILVRNPHGSDYIYNQIVDAAATYNKRCPWESSTPAPIWSRRAPGGAAPDGLW